MSLVNQYVFALVARDPVTGVIINPAAGSSPVADGNGNSVWALPALGPACLPLAGGTMAGSINMNTNNITGVGALAGTINSRDANNILSCGTNGVSGNLPTFTGTAKVLQDSNTALSSLATTAALAGYLPLAGGIMSGSLNMGMQTLTNVASITTSSLLFNMGYSNTPNPVSGSMTVGSFNTGGGTTASIITGFNNNASASTNGQSMIYSNVVHLFSDLTTQMRSHSS